MRIASVRLFSPGEGGSAKYNSYNPTMLLTITTTHRPATDMGYLLHKNPANLHSFDLSFGKAHVFYPSLQNAVCGNSTETSQLGDIKCFSPQSGA
jgi:hypothetical protein